MGTDRQPGLVDVSSWLDDLEVRFATDLPSACGGAVTWIDDDAVRWVLLDPGERWRPPDEVESWVSWCAGFLDAHRWLTAAKVAEHFVVPIEEARGSYWLAAIEWWTYRCVSAS